MFKPTENARARLMGLSLFAMSSACVFPITAMADLQSDCESIQTTVNSDGPIDLIMLEPQTPPNAEARITSATYVEAVAATATVDAIPAYCEVRGIADTDASEANCNDNFLTVGPPPQQAPGCYQNFAVRLPAYEVWLANNQRLVMGATSGALGGIAPLTVHSSYAPLDGRTTNWMQFGVVMAGGDHGHIGQLVPWAFDNPGTETPGISNERELDFDQYGMLMSTLAANAVIREFYGVEQSRTYCVDGSDAARDCLEMADSYPELFDGVAGRAPLYDPVNTLGVSSYNVQQMYPDGLQPGSEPVISFNEIDLLHTAILDACDGIDGVVDGMLNDPRMCTVPLKRILPRCNGAPDTDECFTNTEIKLIRGFYKGKALGNGFRPAPLARGSEGQVGPGPFPGPLANNTGGWKWIYLGGIVPGLNPPPATPNPGASFASLLGTFIHQQLLEDSPTGSVYDIDFKTGQGRKKWVDAFSYGPSPDLRDFRDKGGKVMIWHGWMDALNPPQTSINLFKDVRKAISNKSGHKRTLETQEFFRVYMAPGLTHEVPDIPNTDPNFRDGPGPRYANVYNKLVAWVENDMAPESLDARNPATGLERLWCSYPEIGFWNGTGSADDASNYECRHPKRYKRGQTPN